MKGSRFNRKNSKLDYVLFLSSTTIIGTPIFCALMEIVKDFMGWIM